jgi:outer membrane protein assembly factor BamB
MISLERGLPQMFEPGEKRSDGSGIDPTTTESVRWVAPLGSQTYGNPTVAGGRVFVGSNDFRLDDPRFQSTAGGTVKCFDEATGRLLWQLVVPRFYSHDQLLNFDDMDLGVCSAPTVDGDRVYVVTNRCEVLCLDVRGMADGNEGVQDEGQYMAGPGRPPMGLRPGDGDILWRFDTMHELPCWPQDAAASSALVYGDLVYIGTSNGVDKSNTRVPFPNCPSLIVLDKRTGRLVAWDDEKIGTRLFHGQWSSPSLGRVGEKTLVFFGAGDGVCYAFEALDRVPETPRPLRRVWSCDCNPPHYRSKDGKPIPYINGDVRRKLGNRGDGSYVGPSEIIATPVFDKGRVYVAIGQDPLHGRGRGMLSCIDATKTGDLSTSGRIWSFDQMDRSLSTVSVAEGLVYVADYIGKLYCLDADSGKLYWTHDTKAEIWGSTLVADGKVYLGTQKHFWVFAAGKEKQVLAQIRLGSPSWCTPVVANGVLYVASQRYLWAVKEED